MLIIPISNIIQIRRVWLKLCYVFRSRKYSQPTPHANVLSLLHRHTRTISLSCSHMVSHMELLTNIRTTQFSVFLVNKHELCNSGKSYLQSTHTRILTRMHRHTYWTQTHMPLETIHFLLDWATSLGVCLSVTMCLYCLVCVCVCMCMSVYIGHNAVQKWMLLSVLKLLMD